MRRIWMLAALAAPGAVAAETPMPVVVSSAPRAEVVTERREARYDFNADGTYVATVTNVVRPVTAAAAQALAIIPLPASRSLQRFELLPSFVDTPDGKRVAVDPATVQLQAPPYAAAAGTLSDVELHAVPVPALAPGARLTLATRLTQVVPDFPGHVELSFVDPPSSAIEAQRVVVSAPVGMKLTVEDVGWGEEPARTENGRVVRTWARVGAPYRQARPESTCACDWAPRLRVSSWGTWGDLARAYEGRAAAAEAPTPAVRELAAKLLAGASGERDKAERITRWVRENVRYVNLQLGNGGFVPRPADEVLANRYGDCKGHTTLALALLAAAGVRAEGALVNLSPSYVEPGVPTPQAFNHIIVYLPGLDLWADTTSRFARLGDVPPALQGKMALLTRSGRLARLPNANAEPDATATVTEMTAAPDGTLAGTAVMTMAGSNRAALRGLLAGLATTDRARLAAAFLSGQGVTGTGTLEAGPDGESLRGRFTEATQLDFTGPGALALASPMTLASIAGTTRVSQEPMDTPAQCHAARISETVRLAFPDAVRVAALPRGVAIDTPDIHYASAYRQDGQVVTAERVYESRFPDRPCTPVQMADAVAAKRRIARDLAAQVLWAPK